MKNYITFAVEIQNQKLIYRNKKSSMTKIKRFGKINESIGISYDEAKDICSNYERLKLLILHVAIEKWNDENSDRDDLQFKTKDCSIDWVEDFGDRGICVQFFDKYGNDYNVELTREDLS